MKLIFLGPPGAGKGTQALGVGSRLNVPHISTGNMLRAAVRNETPMGLAAKKYMDAGKLVPDEVLIDVKIINVNLVSFNEILDETGGDDTLVCRRVLEIIHERGKLHNPVTNSGGMLYGSVRELGPEYPNHFHIKPKDEIISLASLTVTPLRIERIVRVDHESAQLEVE